MAIKSSVGKRYSFINRTDEEYWLILDKFRKFDRSSISATVKLAAALADEYLENYIKTPEEDRPKYCTESDILDIATYDIFDGKLRDKSRYKSVLYIVGASTVSILEKIGLIKEVS